MYTEYYSQDIDTGMYLERIGQKDAEISLTKDCLNRLTLAHAYTVPFENLDIYEYEKDIDIKTRSVFEKVVMRRRGGYCFELNCLFMSLLENLGFEVFPVGARVLNGAYEMSIVSHRATVAVIDGKRYFCDVGLGTPLSCEAICIDSAGPQQCRGYTFSVRERDDGHLMVLRHKAGCEQPVLMFRPKPFFIPDFLALNYYFSKNPASYFRSKRMVNLRTPSGGISVDGSVLRRIDAGVVAETAIESRENMERILESEFGLSVRIARPV